MSISSGCRGVGLCVEQLALALMLWPGPAPDRACGRRADTGAMPGRKRLEDMGISWLWCSEERKGTRITPEATDHSMCIYRASTSY